MCPTHESAGECIGSVENSSNGHIFIKKKGGEKRAPFQQKKGKKWTILDH